MISERRISRRKALLGLGAASGAGLVDAFGIEPSWLDVATHEVPITALPRGLDGLKVAQVTDAHLSEMGSLEEQLLETIRAERVQIVALTGDIIDSTSAFGALGDFCSELARTGARVLATLGNWEHWGKIPLDELRRLYSAFGVQLLVNEETRAEGIAFSVTDDSTAGEVDFHRAISNAQPEARILLTHSPSILDGLPSAAPRFDLALAGHTHGGQLRLSSHVVPFVPPGSGRFVGGWYETAKGRAYVSRGTGTSIIPARFTCRPEMPIFRLRQG